MACPFSLARQLAGPLLVLASAAPPIGAELLVLPERPADGSLAAFRQAIDALHERTLAKRKPLTEAALQEAVPKRFLQLEEKFAKAKDPKRGAEALAQLAVLYAELAWVERIRPIEDRLESLDRELRDRLGHFAESEHFLVRVAGCDPKWADAALRLAEAAHAGYAELFGFTELSKVAGKKVRILIHVDPGHTAPRLYFHPGAKYHSELRYEVPDEKYLTLSGKHRIVYGFCHELGHMIAMWGEYRGVEDDKHAWAHYTGCLIVEEVYERLGNEPWPTWTAFQRRASGKARLLGQIQDVTPGRTSYASILALFHAIGKEFGTRAYGDAWSWLEEKKRFRRVEHVRYLWLRDLEEALLRIVPPAKVPRVKALFGAAAGGSP